MPDSSRLTTFDTLPVYLLRGVNDFLDTASILAVTDTGGKIVVANPNFCEISGYSEAELIGQNHRILKSGEHPDSFFEEMWRTISKGNTWVGEICNKNKAGELYWVYTTISPIKGPQGKITHYVSLRIDITAKKKAERDLHLLLEQQAEKKRLEGLGRLADGVLHDLNNMLTVASTAIGLIPPETKHSDLIFNVLTRMAHLTRNLRDFASGKNLEKRQINIASLISQVANIALFKEQRVGAVRFEQHIKPISDCLVVGNEGQLLEVFLNLFGNAAEALAKTPKARLQISGEFDELTQQVVLFISDNGPGISETVRAHLFEPYFSTKGPGRGLGLSVTRQIVADHLGRLSVVPAEIGTTFKLEFPAIRTGASETRPSGPIHRQKGMILIADDDKGVREAIANAASKAGYTPITAAHSDEVMAIADRLTQNLVGVMLDSTGRENEYAVIGILRKANPHIPIVLASATLTKKEVLQTKYGPVHCLPKPFQMAELFVLFESYGKAPRDVTRP